MKVLTTSTRWERKACRTLSMLRRWWSLFHEHLAHNTSVIYLWNTHTHPFNGPLSGTTRVSRWEVKPIWILLKQETVSGSGISWAICKCAPCSRQITTPAPHHSDFYRPDALPATQPTVSKHWRDFTCENSEKNKLTRTKVLRASKKWLNVILYCISE